MPTETARVRRYFEEHAEAFDRIYARDPGSVRGRLERWRRRSMFERFRHTLAACGEVRGQRVLDVGCGSGRYAIALARQGAEVVGVDLAPAMVELAGRMAQEAGVAAQCRFLCGDVLTLPLAGPFACSLAIGFFDYTRDPALILARMRELTRGRIIASFPVHGHWLTPIRWARLSLAGCPVHFYSEAQVSRLLAGRGGRVAINALGRDYLAVADTSPDPQGRAG